MSEWEPTRPQHEVPSEPPDPDLPTGPVPTEPPPFGEEPVAPESGYDETVAMPGVGEPPPILPPEGPGGPFGPGGPGGPIGPGGPFGPEDEPWYRRRGPLAAVIAVGLALLFLLIAFLIWLFNDDGDDSITTTDDTTTTSSIESTTTTTVPETTTTVADTTTTTTVETTTTTTSTTTTVVETTTTAAPTTTQPPTTPPPTTAAPTTAAPTTTPPTTTTTTVPVVTVPPQPGATVWDVILNSPDLSRFRELAELAGIQDALSSEAISITLLTPSNDAFAVAEGGVGAPDYSNPDVVREILLTHLHEDDVYLVPDIFELGEFTVVEGGPHAIEDGEVGTIGGARLIVDNIEAANGVLHVTDLVLQP